MDQLQNDEIQTTPLRSDLSDFRGAILRDEDMKNEGICVGEDKVENDKLDFALRVFEFFPDALGLDGYSVGPGVGSPTVWCIWDLFKNSSLLKNLCSYYEGVAYDIINFRFTLSNPKGVAGSLVVGGGPYNNWTGTAFNNLGTYAAQNKMTLQGLLLAPESHLMCFSQAEDISFSLPWQSNIPYWSTDALLNYDPTKEVACPWPGAPCVFAAKLGCTYVSSVALPGLMRIFISFDGLRWVGPRVKSAVLTGAEFSKQSGAEMAVASAAAAGVAAVGEEILSEVFSAVSSVFDTDDYKDGSYESPQAMQMAYVGDSTSLGPPPTAPIFRSWQTMTRKKHAILDFLKEPQWIGSTESGTTQTVYANPVAMLGNSDYSGPDQQCNWFRYFSKTASYWRGTMMLHVVICGHPMVEVAYKLSIGYCPNSQQTSGKMSENSVLSGICSGIRHIVVPMPSLSPFDHFPVLDRHDLSYTDVKRFTPSVATFRVDVLSTMLDITPKIPVEMFMSAGDDFEFLQPRAVGLGDVEDAVFKKQVGLPEVYESFQTRAKVQNSTGVMVAPKNVEDLMQIWSRALPYSIYDSNDEPVVSLRDGINPCWFPPEGGSVAHTLNTNNSWFVTNDYISYISSLFLYFRGSIGFKICIDETSTTGYAYVTLDTGLSDVGRQPSNNPFTATSGMLPPESNLGFGTVVTPVTSQPVMELTIPQRSFTAYGLCNPLQLAHTVELLSCYPYEWNGGLRTNISLHAPSGDLQSALYRKAGSDFQLAVRSWIPPPTLWVASGWDWS